MGWTATAMRLEEFYDRKLPVPNTSEMFLITEKDYQPQMDHNDFERRFGKNRCYSINVNGSRECRICALPGGRNHVFSSDEEKANMCKIFKMEEVKLPN